MTSRRELDAVATKIKGKTGRLSKVQVTPERELAPLPYCLETLQRDGSARYGFKAQTVLDACQALYEKLYNDVLKVKVVGMMLQPMGPDPLGWFKQPISSVEDFKKMKYRAPPGITGEIFKEMGVSAVAMPGGEIVPAAQRGVIDAAEWIGPADDVNLGLHRVWKHYYLQGLHQSTDVGEVIFNKGWFDKQSPEV